MQIVPQIFQKNTAQESQKHAILSDKFNFVCLGEGVAV